MSKQYSEIERDLQLQVNQLLLFCNKLLEELSNTGCIDKISFTQQLQKDFDQIYKIEGQALISIYN